MHIRFILLMYYLLLLIMYFIDVQLRYKIRYSTSTSDDTSPRHQDRYLADLAKHISYRSWESIVFIINDIMLLEIIESP